VHVGSLPWAIPLHQ